MSIDIDEPIPAEALAAAPGTAVAVQDEDRPQYQVWLNGEVIGVLFDESAAKLTRGNFAAWSPRGKKRNGIVGFFGTLEEGRDAIGRLYGSGNGAVAGGEPDASGNPEQPTADGQTVTHQMASAVLIAALKAHGITGARVEAYGTTCVTIPCGEAVIEIADGYCAVHHPQDHVAWSAWLWTGGEGPGELLYEAAEAVVGDCAADSAACAEGLARWISDHPA